MTTRRMTDAHRVTRLRNLFQELGVKRGLELVADALEAAGYEAHDRRVATRMVETIRDGLVERAVPRAYFPAADRVAAIERRLVRDYPEHELDLARMTSPDTWER